ncbi:MAG: hypothetical protein K0B00_08300 [Rhodobacteraceae bacterium]|nr:hypothetical protein [Paracoccaceae bacterium]
MTTQSEHREEILAALHRLETSAELIETVADTANNKIITDQLYIIANAMRGFALSGTSNLECLDRQAS